jgi:nucleotide-binding universal stress UspA family protein
MKLLERILVTTDLGRGSDDAVKTARSVVKTFHSDVVLLHVMPGTVAPLAATDAIREPLAQRLQQIADDFRTEGSQVVEPVIASGAPFDKIVACANQHDVNVVIIGSGEKTDAESFHLGLTAIDVSRNATKPVWVVKRGASPQINKIVCPVEFSAPSRRALSNAIHLSRSFGAELTVLHVVRPLSKLFLGLGRVSPESQQAHLQAQQLQFERFLRDFDLHDVRWTKVTRQGGPHQEILAMAAQTEADLIVMGSGTRSGIARMFMGSVAEDVVGEMPCSVITVKSEHVIRLRLDAATGDIKAQCSEAQALLDTGFPAEARRQFEQVVTRDRTYTPAWNGLAAVYRRLGDEKQAEKWLNTAKEIARSISETQATAEARGRHVLSGRRPPLP